MNDPPKIAPRKSQASIVEKKVGRSREHLPSVLSAAEPVLTAMDYAGVFRASPTLRIAMIRSGVRAQEVVSMAAALGRTQVQVVETLGLAVSTFNRKLAHRKPLSLDESERVIGLAKLVGQVQVMVEESGVAAGFDANHWFANWIDAAVPALGGHRPIEYLDTSEGRDMVSNLLGKMQSGAYA
jgi:putative toxin-antitoxin system antitoxin component (TIGR02293 family)